VEIMINVKRWYIYLICTISLQAVTWAFVDLIGTLFAPNVNALRAATPVAIIVVGLPVFLGHWIWANRLASSLEERGSTLRRFYLYANAAVFLVRLALMLVYLLYWFWGFLDAQIRTTPGFSTDYLLSEIIITLLFAGLCYFMYRTIRQDASLVPEAGGSATVRRLFVLSFSGYGLSLVVVAITGMLRLLFGLLAGRMDLSGVPVQSLLDFISRLTIGVILWVVFWRIAGHLFESPDQEERHSSLRKLYLYLAVFIGTLCVVIYSSMILTGLLKRLLQVSGGKGDLVYILPIILIMGVVWIYHALVLRDDVRMSEEAPRQATIRRWYLYLVATVGLASLLTGLSGDISVLLRSLGSNLWIGLRGEFATFTAAILAGLFVWYIPWRQAQAEVSESPSAGPDARRSVARKFYLYFFLLAATLAVLGASVYIVASIVRFMMGEAPPTINQLGMSIATLLLGVGVWLYHGTLLRADGRSLSGEKAKIIKTLRMVVIDAGEWHFGKAIAEQLMRDLPSLKLDLFELTKAPTKKSQTELVASISKAGLIVGPWTIAVAGGAGGVVSPAISGAIAASSAEKLLIPVNSEGWRWIGQGRSKPTEVIIRQTVREVKQLLGKGLED
jgi:uncharacterized membrane protein YhdT